MAEDKAPEPRALTYKEVEKAYGGDSSAANSAWQKICDIAGTGNVPPSDTATIGLTHLSEGKIKSVDAVLADAKKSDAKAPAGNKATGGNE